MDTSTAQLKQIQSKEIELFRAFISVCEQLNLPYFVVGGTLLGAVRHKGFIPWDDDIDIAMLRSDYEIFLSRAKEFLPENVFLQTIDTDPEYLANYAKLRHNETTFIESAVKSKHIHHGLFIDIFPLDYYPASSLAKTVFQIRNKLYVHRISCEFEGIPFPGYYKPIHLLLKLLYPSVRTALRKRDKLFKKYTKGQKLASHCGAWGKKEIVPAGWYQSTVTLEFEGIQVTAPADYDAWLRHYYGDYMQLPPVEKRITHHYTEVIDLDTPYTQYIQNK